jgi:transcription-repair coupling factor (superfamily II helicase)
VQDFIAELQRGKDAGEQAVFVATTSGRAERMLELARDYHVIAMAATAAEDTHQAALLVTIGHLARGFRLPEGGLVIYAEADVFEEERRAPEQARRRSATSVFLSDLRDLKVGDYVVHVDHGIGAFVGLKQLAVAPGEPPQEFMELRYAGEDKLFVPVERLDLVQKYTGRDEAAGRSARWHDLGESEDARQEGHARHGRGAAEALRRAQGRSRLRVHRRLPLAGRVRGRLSL